jgi:hypothetical protein
LSNLNQNTLIQYKKLFNHKTKLMMDVIDQRILNVVKLISNISSF